MVKRRLVFCFFLSYTKKYPPIFAGRLQTPALRGLFMKRQRYGRLLCAFTSCTRRSTSPKRSTAFFFETDSIDEAKDFAMRLAFDETNNVYVQDTKREEIVRDFDALVYRV